MVYVQKIGEVLERIHTIVQNQNGSHILHTSQVSRLDRELMVRSGWLQEIIKGWYLLVRPDGKEGDSSAWYASFWNFVSVYSPLL